MFGWVYYFWLLTILPLVWSCQNLQAAGEVRHLQAKFMKCTTLSSSGRSTTLLKARTTDLSSLWRDFTVFNRAFFYSIVDCLTKKEKIMQISNSCQFNCKQCVEYYAQHFKNYTNQKLDNITSVNLVFIVKNTWKCKWQIISLLQYIHRMSLNTPRPDSLPSSVQHSEQKHHRHHRAVRLHSICSASRLLD